MTIPYNNSNQLPVQLANNEPIAAPSINRAITKLIANDTALDAVAGKILVNSADTLPNTFDQKVLAGPGIYFTEKVNSLGQPALEIRGEVVTQNIIVDPSGGGLSAVVSFDSTNNPAAAGYLTETTSLSTVIGRSPIKTVDIISLSSLVNTHTSEISALSANIPAATSFGVEYSEVMFKSVITVATDYVSTSSTTGSYGWINTMSGHTHTWPEIFSALTFPTGVKKTEIICKNVSHWGAGYAQIHMNITIDFINKKVYGMYNQPTFMVMYIDGTFTWPYGTFEKTFTTITNLYPFTVGTFAFDASGITKLPVGGTVAGTAYDMEVIIKHYK